MSLADSDCCGCGEGAVSWTHRAASPGSERLALVFSVPGIRVKFQTLADNQGSAKGFNGSSKAFINEVVLL